MQLGLFSIVRKSNHMLAIGSEVPSSAIIYVWLRIQDVSLESLVERSRRYERAYLAWEMVRKVRNPFFEEGTGFEGYFVGIHQSPDEMLARLLEIGHRLLTSNCRLYRHQFAFQSKLMKTLMGELNDPEAIDVWSTLLGATLGKLRCNVYVNHETYRFQNETYWTVNRLPLMCYAQRAHNIEQEYVLTDFKTGSISKPSLDLNLVNSSDHDAGRVVSAIGRFGHPLIREYLQAARISLH
jgi:hypothetical protein